MTTKGKKVVCKQCGSKEAEYVVGNYIECPVCDSPTNPGINFTWHNPNWTPETCQHHQHYMAIQGSVKGVWCFDCGKLLRRV